jgi:hypothetical protein
MSRVNIFGEGGELRGWFDPATSLSFEEDTEWDGNNHISVATGSQFDHEVLYRTEGKRWVVHWFSQWQGNRDTYRYLTDEQAREWLLKNNGDEAVEKFFGPIEAESGPQRLGDTEQWAAIQAQAHEERSLEESDEDHERQFAERRARRVAAGAHALDEAFPVLRQDFTDAWYVKAATIVLDAAEVSDL